jgi:hypothetical protein
MKDVLQVEEFSPVPSIIPTRITREQLQEIEDRMKFEASKPDSGFFVGDHFPLSHSFADGIYVREIRVPAGNYVVTKLFKQNHATFLMQGEVFVITEEGRQHIVAPASWITKKGTKRLIYVLEDCVWTTVHGNPTDEKDVDKIEEFVIAESYEELEAPEPKEKICLG